MSSQWSWAKSETPPKCKLTKWEKQSLVGEAESFLTTFYRTEFLKPAPVNPQFNYIVAFSVRWYGPYLRFSATYACPVPSAIAPFFESPFARLGYFSRDRYNLWARRHNDQWVVMDEDLTLSGCFTAMRENPWFQF